MGKRTLQPYKFTTQLSITLAILVLLWSTPLVAQSNTGFKAEITGVKIGADGRAVVMFTNTDGQGKPFALIELGANSVKFTIAAIKADNTGATNYFNYILTKVSGKEYVFKGDTK